MITKIIVGAFMALALTTNAAAGSQGQCKAWPDLQTSSGGTFQSNAECAKYAAKGGTLFKPSVTTTDSHVSAGQDFGVSGFGFHPEAVITLSIAIAGQPPFESSTGGTTNLAGIFTNPMQFSACLDPSPSTFVLTLTDSYGVHASAPLTLC